MTEEIYSVRHIRPFDLYEGGYLDLWQVGTKVHRVLFGSKFIVLTEFLDRGTAISLCRYLNGNLLYSHPSNRNFESLRLLVADAERAMYSTTH